MVCWHLWMQAAQMLVCLFKFYTASVVWPDCNVSIPTKLLLAICLEWDERNLHCCWYNLAHTKHWISSFLLYSSLKATPVSTGNLHSPIYLTYPLLEFPHAMVLTLLILLPVKSMILSRGPLRCLILSGKIHCKTQYLCTQVSIVYYRYTVSVYCQSA